MRECPECGVPYGDEAVVCPDDGARLVPEASASRSGQTVGSYVLTRPLGRGGMGTVYLAEHPAIGSRVAVKFLHRRYAGDPVIVERFFNEARAVNLIGHENIVRVQDFAIGFDGTPYFVMEYLQGEPLSKRIGRPMPLAELGPIALQVADALQAAHERGIVHRDLKADNVFLVATRHRADVVKLLGFGIAKLLVPGHRTQRTQTGLVLGTALTMAPEQAAGEGASIGPATDVYSFGVLLFQMATGRLPFPGPGFADFLVQHMTMAPPRPRDLVPTMPEGLEALVLRCLQKKPADRFRSMAELSRALARLMETHALPLELRPPPPPNPAMSVRATAERTTQPHRPTRRWLMRSRSSLVAGLFVVLVAGGGTLAWRSAVRSSPPPPPAALASPGLASVAAAPARVRVEVRAEPSTARLTVRREGGVESFALPARLDLPVSTPVVLRLEAEGYRAVERSLAPTEDEVWSQALQPLSRPVERPRSPTPGPKKARAPAPVGDGALDVEF